MDSFRSCLRRWLPVDYLTGACQSYLPSDTLIDDEKKCYLMLQVLNEIADDA